MSDDEKMVMTASFMDDEAESLKIETTEFVNGAAVKSPAMLATAKRCMNRIKSEVMRQIDGTQEFNLEVMMRNIGIVYFAFRNQENTICFKAGQRMAEVEQLEQMLGVE